MLPENLNELLSFKKDNPEAVIFSGGTEIVLKKMSKKITEEDLKLADSIQNAVKKDLAENGIIMDTDLYYENQQDSTKTINKGKNKINFKLFNIIDYIRPFIRM